MDVETEQQVIQENGDQVVSREVETVKAEEVPANDENKEESNSAEAEKPAPEEKTDENQNLEQDQKNEEKPAEEPKQGEQEQQQEAQENKEEPTEEPKEEEKNEEVQNEEKNEEAQNEEAKNEEVQNEEKNEEAQAEEETNGQTKYQKVIAEAIALYEELLDTAKWNLDSDKDGVKGYSRLDEGTGLRMARGDGVINHPVDKISEAILDHVSMMKWEGNLVMEKTVEQVDDFHVVISLDKKRPFVAQRETLMLNQITKKEDGTFLMVGKSVTHDDYPEKKDYVRAQVHFSSWTLTPDKEDPNKTHGIYMIFVDPKGWVPKPVFNAFVSDQASNVKKLRNFLKGK